MPQNPRSASHEDALVHYDPTLTYFRDDLEALGRSYRTVNQYTQSTARFYAWMKAKGVENPTPEHINKATLNGWVAHLRKADLAINSIRHYILGFKAYVSWLSENDLLPGNNNPFDTFAVPQTEETPKRVLTPEEVRIGVEFLIARKHLRDAAIVTLIFDSGIRSNEVRTLTWQQVDRQKRVMVLGDAEGRKTKNREIRYTGFSVETGKLLLRWRRSRKHSTEEDLVFPSRTGNQLSQSALWDLIHDGFQRAGIEGVGTHSLRHTWASNAIISGVNPMVLKTAGGWKSLEMVEHYTKSVLQQHSAVSIRDLGLYDQAVANAPKKKRA